MKRDTMFPEILNPQAGGKHFLARLIEDEHLPDWRARGNL